MPGWRNFFQPRPGRFGVNASTVQGGPEGNTVTANTTTTFVVGGFNYKAMIERLAIATRVVPADADGALTAIIYKRDASAAANVALTAAFNLETGLVALRSVNVPLLTTLTPTDLLLDDGDTVICIVTSDSAAIDTQPSGMRVIVDAAVLE